MAITNYGELQTAIGNWMNRADLTGFIPDWIMLAATRIYYGSDDEILPSEPVRTWSMLTSSALTVTNAAAALPSDFLAIQTLYGSDGQNTWTVDYKTPSQFGSVVPTNQTNASFFTILGNQIQLSSTSTTSVTLYYYKIFTPMSGNSDTNALLTAAPGLWLYASLIEGAVFTNDDNSAKKWHRMYRAIESGLNNTAMETGGGTLQVRLR